MDAGAHGRIGQTVGWELAFLLKVHRARAAKALAHLGLHPGQDVLLSVMWDEEGLTQSELARRLEVEPPTVTKVLERLERSGLVHRRRDERDARVSRVFLTAAGRRLRHEVEGVWAELDAVMVAGLDAGEQRTLRDLLGRLRGNLG
jgi:DNA-binding MarR family transcriptional regulator